MLKFLAGSSCLLMAAAAAQAAPADGAAIEAAIVGHTVQGEMAVSGRYTEFYAKDGKIHGKDYTGSWTIENDQMCFSYGHEPASCWQVEIHGTNVTWIKDGRADGTGTIVEGNPNGY
ncbi:MAG TPA: hypothetical protein VHL31_07860 [Geminicoccus sp.]|jgi:opacity protein-like surface antigen|uniref:hypothetical protein n=1 Tax=Geminicoccus sp. TaxID=2024832 RepID=UPI002E34E3C8|nr:hypothetical protein [Geminicoccus sp.]HEX2526202.1 hypothetical protein [Geminicoccus sp.]